jgi:hypothetical protein
MTRTELMRFAMAVVERGVAGLDSPKRLSSFGIAIPERYSVERNRGLSFQSDGERRRIKIDAQLAAFAISGST